MPIPATKKRIWKSTKGSTDRKPILAAADADAHKAAKRMPRRIVFRFNVYDFRPTKDKAFWVVCCTTSSKSIALISAIRRATNSI